MRTRLIRPGFFSDETLARVSVATRLFYIGLWTLCDDAGYFEVRPREIAASLFPYDAQARRAKVVQKGLEELQTLERVELLECGQHGIVPTLPRHGQKGGNQSYTYRDRHRSEWVRTSPDKSVPTVVRTSPDKSSSVSVSVSVSDSGQGSSSDSLSADAPLKQAAESAGGFVARIAAKGAA